MAAAVSLPCATLTPVEAEEALACLRAQAKEFCSQQYSAEAKGEGQQEVQERVSPIGGDRVVPKTVQSMAAV